VKRALSLIAALTLLAALLPGAAPTASVPAAPFGLTGIALDGQVELAWQPVAGATSYSVYRGSNRASITTRISPTGGIAATTFTDTGASNGSTYFYAVRATASGVESADSYAVEATPRSRACAAGNPVVLENCFPGTPAWNVSNPGSVVGGGIEGFASATSINKGGSVDLKVKSGDPSTFRVEIFRSGYYGGDGARLFSVVHGLRGVLQPLCVKDSQTGLVDCSNWSVSATITTTASWPSGVYLLRLVREDTASDNQILLTIRDDGSNSDLLYGVADTTFQAYNNFGGKSLYDSSSTGGTTIAGTPRAVKVSFDRPYEQPRSLTRNWYTRTDHPLVYWLEREGFDVAYQSDVDLERRGALVRNHEAYVSPAHDEYFSAAMRSALEQARDAGVSLFFSGSNEIYWKIRFEDSPVAGGLDRVQVNYKSTQSGGPDPSGIPTGTWRDPAGANRPENALTGVMYIGDADNTFFPLEVSAAEGTDRVYRYTGLEAQAPGTSTRIGSTLVGWEWDARFSNGVEPAGVKTLASSPVTGNLIQGNGAYQTPGSATAHVVKYTAPSGALVFTTGTNYWARGLARNIFGQGEPNLIIQQTTTNVLADMGVHPVTPAADITLDEGSADRPPAPTGVSAEASGVDGIRISWSQVAGADGYNVYRTLTPRDGGQPLGARATPSIVTGTSFTDIGLPPATTYHYVVTSVKNGIQSVASNEASATTPAAAGEATRINVQGLEYATTTGQLFREDAFFTGGNRKVVTTPVAGTNDPELYQDERWGDFSYAIPVANGRYNVRFHFVELYYGTSEPGGPGKRVFGMDILDTPVSPDINDLDIYAEVGPNHALIKTVEGVSITDGILDLQSVYGVADDPELAAIEIVPEAAPPTVTQEVPAMAATGISPSVLPRATFSRSLDASTVSPSSFTLRDSTGTLVPATVTYDAPTKTATLRPDAPLATSSTYTARLETTIRALDGVALESPVSWTFTTADVPPPAPTVTATNPADAASGVARSASIEATFSRAMDAATITTGSFSLSGPAGPVTAMVNYDPATRVARLMPSSVLAFSTTYTARLETTILASDDTPLASAVVWSFATLDPPPPPAVTTHTPADDASFMPRAATVTATFSRAMDAATINVGTFSLRDPGGVVVPAAISYDPVTNTATLTPASLLNGNTDYTARLEGTIEGADGAALGTAVTWSFSTAACPCSLFPATTAPARQNNPVADARVGPGPWSYELGVKVKVEEPMIMTGFRYYKSSRETGLHVGKLFTVGGAELARETFQNETAAGWQHQALATSIPLDPGVTYVVSVNANAYFAITQFGLLSQVISGPLRSVADGANGVYGASAGVFPTQSYRSSNYFVDLEVVPDGDPPPPAVSSTSPADGASGVARTSTVRATFSRSMQPSTLNSSAFTLRNPSGTPIPATVAYDEASKTAVLTPSTLLQYSTTYTARISTAARARNGIRLSAPVEWSFTVADPVPPVVVSTLPVPGAADLGSGVAPRAEFDKDLKPETVTTSTFTLDGPSGPVAASVAYDATRKEATLTPSAALAPGAYTVRLDASITAVDDAALATSYSWGFTVQATAGPLTVASWNPATGAADVSREPDVQATFTRSVDPATITGETFLLRDSAGALIPAAVAYDEATETAHLRPSTLTASTTYTAELTVGVRAADGTPLTPATATFTTGTCPCSLFSPSLLPARTGLPTRDGRALPGPWSYELGVKVTVDQTMDLTAIRFYKDARETGLHTATVWSASGVIMARVPVAGETASGWQQQRLATPLRLDPATTYVVSVNANSYFVATTSGLLTQVVSGPLRSVADGNNGVFGSSAEVFPNRSSRSSNYFVDLVVR
jgi:hypothetical protein